MSSEKKKYLPHESHGRQLRVHALPEHGVLLQFYLCCVRAQQYIYMSTLHIQLYYCVRVQQYIYVNFTYVTLLLCTYMSTLHVQLYYCVRVQQYVYMSTLLLTCVCCVRAITRKSRSFQGFGFRARGRLREALVLFRVQLGLGVCLGIPCNVALLLGFRIKGYRTHGSGIRGSVLRV